MIALGAGCRRFESCHPDNGIASFSGPRNNPGLFLYPMEDIRLFKTGNPGGSCHRDVVVPL